MIIESSKNARVMQGPGSFFVSASRLPRHLSNDRLFRRLRSPGPFKLYKIVKLDKFRDFYFTMQRLQTIFYTFLIKSFYKAILEMTLLPFSAQNRQGDWVMLDDLAALHNFKGEIPW